jgi:hypothetical protein
MHEVIRNTYIGLHSFGGKHWEHPDVDGRRNNLQ